MRSSKENRPHQPHQALTKLKKTLKGGIQDSKPEHSKPAKRKCLGELNDFLNKENSFSFNKSLTPEVTDDEADKSKESILKPELFRKSHENLKKLTSSVEKIQDLLDIKTLEFQKIGFLSIYQRTEKIQNKFRKFFKLRNKKTLAKCFKILKRAKRSPLNFKQLFRKSQNEEIRLEYASKFRELIVKRSIMTLLKGILKPRQKRKPEVINERLSLFINNIQNILPKKASVKSEEKTPEKSESLDLEHSSSGLDESFENIIQDIPVPFENKSEFSGSTCAKSNNSNSQSQKQRKPSLKELELRALKRKENNRKIKEKHNEVLEKKKMEKIHEEEKLKEEDKRRKLEEIARFKQKKKEEEEKKEQKKADKKKRKILLEKCLAFRNRTLLRKFGLQPWKKLIEILRNNEKMADKFLRKTARQALFCKLQEAFSLCKIERNIKEAKNLERAKELNLRVLRRKLFGFLKKYQQMRISYEKNFDNIREDFLKRTVFSKWFGIIPFFKEKNRKKEEEYAKIIKKFRLMLVGEKVMRAWRKEITQKKKEFFMKKDLKVSKVTPPKKSIKALKN